MKRAPRGRPKNSGFKIPPARVAALQSQGLTYAEIAKTLGIGKAYVSKLLTQARTEAASTVADRLQRFVDAVNAGDSRAIGLLDQWEPSDVSVVVLDRTESMTTDSSSPCEP